MTSPYDGVPTKNWQSVTEDLIRSFPIPGKILVEVVLGCWDSIFSSKIGTGQFQIGKDIFPDPQIMGYFLHELIPLELQRRYPKEWKKGGSDGKDLEYLANPEFSFEIKTSSHPKSIFGNRSYAQPAERGKKSKSGYYLAVNFEKFSDTKSPKVLQIRFGWLDHSDWIAQKAATGQSARLTKEADESKILKLHAAKKG